MTPTNSGQGSNPEIQELQKMLEAAENAENKTGTDNYPEKTVDDVNIDHDELKEMVLSDYQNDISDREDMGFAAKREYDLKVYHGVKDPAMMNFPYAGASAYVVPITQVQLETAVSMTIDLKWRNPNKVVTVTPVNDGDGAKSKNLEWLLNWQALNDVENMKIKDAGSDFLMYLHGTAFEKILRTSVDPKNYRLDIFNCPIQYIFMPIDSEGPDIGQSDHVTQLIPLSVNDMRARLASGVYKNLDKVGKSLTPQSLSAESIRLLQEQIAGLALSQKMMRDTYWIGETYKTYYPKGSMRSVELIIHFSPITGDILRCVKNTDNMRPYVAKYVYPNEGMAFHRSLPEIIRNVQEKANYADKQKTDATDKAISPAGFYDGTERFDPRLNLRAPTGMYPMKNVNSIQWEPTNLAPILAQSAEIKNLWLEAERVTGFTDLNQGISTSTSANTLGQDVMRSQRSDIRFGKVRMYINAAWKRKISKIYQYDDIYMPRETKVKVLGTNRYSTIEKLFPRETGGDFGIGMIGKFDFSVCNLSIDEQEKQNMKRSAFFGAVQANPLFGNDLGNAYRAMNEQAEAEGIYDLEYVVKKPKEANQFTPDEVIARFLDGEEVLPDPDVNFADYISAVEIFMRTGNFADADPKIQQSMMFYLEILKRMRASAVLAFQDFSTTENVKSDLMAQAQAQPGQPAPQPSPNQPMPTGAM